MTRFLLIVSHAGADESWLEASVDELRDATGFTNAHRLGGTVLLGDRDFAAVQQDGQWSCFIGDMWNANTVQPELSGGLRSAYCRPGVTRSLGGFIHYWQDENERSHQVYRDPSGREACYHFETSKAHIFASDLKLIRHFLEHKLDVDLDAIVHGLIHRDFRSPQTCVCGVTEVLPGHAFIIENRKSRLACFWSPWDHIGDEAQHAGPPAAGLRDVIVELVASAGVTRSHILLELSGGLDSSILAAALHRSGIRFSTLTYVPFGPDGDERRYAQAVSDAFGCEAHIRFTDASEVDIGRSAASHLPRPSAKIFSQEFDRQGIILANDVGADAIFNGGGGDTVLGYFHSSVPLVERYRSQGIGRGLWTTARDMSAICDVTMWEVLGSAWRRRSGSQQRRWHADGSFLTDQAMAGYGQNLAHPWLDRATVDLPAKRFQIESLLGIYNHLDGAARGRAMPLIFPLLAQPVLECCLAIPSWLSCANGQNRSVARSAFADILPKSIVRRRSKGGFDGLCFDIYHLNRSRIREMLLEGRLASAAILDRDHLETYLTSDRIPEGVELNRILALVDCEAWLHAVS